MQNSLYILCSFILYLHKNAVWGFQDQRTISLLISMNAKSKFLP